MLVTDPVTLGFMVVGWGSPSSCPSTRSSRTPRRRDRPRWRAARAGCRRRLPRCCARRGPAQQSNQTVRFRRCHSTLHLYLWPLHGASRHCKACARMQTAAHRSRARNESDHLVVMVRPAASWPRQGGGHAHVCEGMCYDHAARREGRSQHREQAPPHVDSLRRVQI